MRISSKYAEREYLLAAPAPDVFRYLEEHFLQQEDHYWLSNEEQDLVNELFARNERLIDLGSIRITSNNQIIEEILKRYPNTDSEKFIKRHPHINVEGVVKDEDFLDIEPVFLEAAFSNRAARINWWLHDKKVINHIAISATEEQLAALFKNPNLPRKILEDLFLRKEAFQNGSQDRRVILLQYALQNPLITQRLKSPYPILSEGFSRDQAEYHGTIGLAWRLLLSEEPTPDMACIFAWYIPALAEFNASKIEELLGLKKIESILDIATCSIIGYMEKTGATAEEVKSIVVNDTEENKEKYNSILHLAPSVSKEEVRSLVQAEDWDKNRASFHETKRMFCDAVFQRWKTPKGYKNSYEDDYYNKIRENLAARIAANVWIFLKKEEFFTQNEDVAIRRGYYKETSNIRTIKILDEFADKDGLDFWEAAAENRNFYRLDYSDITKEYESDRLDTALSFYKTIGRSRNIYEFISRGVNKTLTKLHQENPEIYPANLDDYGKKLHEIDNKRKELSKEKGDDSKKSGDSKILLEAISGTLKEINVKLSNQSEQIANAGKDIVAQSKYTDGLYEKIRKLILSDRPRVYPWKNLEEPLYSHFTTINWLCVIIIGGIGLLLYFKH